MTSKIVAIRLNSPLYSDLCQKAGDRGMTVSGLIRSLVESESNKMELSNLKTELTEKFESIESVPMQTKEILCLCRAIATHLNPQLVSQVKAKLA